MLVGVQDESRWGGALMDRINEKAESFARPELDEPVLSVEPAFKPVERDDLTTGKEVSNRTTIKRR